MSRNVSEAKRDRYVIWALVVLTLGALAIFAYSQTSRNGTEEVAELRKQLYTECLDRVVYDTTSQDARRVAREYWLSYIQAERLNTFIDDKLRAARIASAQTMVDSLGEALKTTVNPRCDRFMPR